MRYKMVICLCVITLLALAPVATGQWQHLGLSAKQVISLESGRYSVDCIYAGTYYEGIFVTNDGGQNWFNRIASNVPVSFISTDPHNQSTILAIVSDSWSAGLYSSTDDGASWQAISFLPHPRRMAFDAELPGYFYICYGDGIQISDDYGINFADANGGLPALDILDVKGHGDNRYEAYAAGEAFVAKTTDFGQSWDDVGGLFGLEDYNPARIAYEPGAPDTLYVTTWAYLARSTDGGDNWDYFQTPTVHNVPIACHPVKPGKLFIGSIGMGVLMSEDAGVTFEDITGDLADLNVYSLDIDISGRLLAGTGNGVYARDILIGVDDTDQPLPQAPALGQNYPNPFNASTKISFSLPDSRPVSLKVYDLLGREVRTLVNGQTPEGSHTVTFDGSELPSGIYFYRLKAGDFTNTKILTLLK